jgi:predicted metalloprotease
MRWSPGSDSSNVEDRRGSRGGMGMAPMGIGGTVILLVLSLIFGRDFISGSDSGTPQQPTAAGDVAPVQQSPAEAREVQFVTFVLDTAQATWAQVLPQSFGAQWHDAKLVLFRDRTPTGCGTGQTAMGPFYCPVDQKVYIDLAFYNELQNRFGASGDFAQAYVITHELGHHVQHLLGIDAKVRDAQERDPQHANALSVALELQADCYSGVWAHHSQDEKMLENGDIEEGLNAAAAVGDDRIQRATTGHVNSDNFTHGSSQQRATWFKRGFSSGDPKQCDTFSGT